MYDSLSNDYDIPITASSSNHDYDIPQGSGKKKKRINLQVKSKQFSQLSHQSSFCL